MGYRNFSWNISIKTFRWNISMKPFTKCHEMFQWNLSLRHFTETFHTETFQSFDHILLQWIHRTWIYIICLYGKESYIIHFTNHLACHFNDEKMRRLYSSYMNSINIFIFQYFHRHVHMNNGIVYICLHFHLLIKTYHFHIISFHNLN